MCTIRKAKNLLVIFGLLFFNVCYAQTSQWDVYNKIPNYKNISLVFNENQVMATGKITDYGGEKKSNERYSIVMTIHDDYTVSLKYSAKLNFDVSETNERTGWFWSHLTTNELVSITGEGILLWKNDKMVLQMNIKEYFPGWYEYRNKTITTTRYSYLLGMNYDHNDNGHSEINIPKHEKSYTYSCDVYYTTSDNLDYLGFDGNIIQSTIYGSHKLVNDNTSTIIDNGSIIYNTYIGLGGNWFQFSAVPKSESELNAENSDIYGKWRWNENRSMIYLCSMTGDDYLVLWNNDNKVSWGFQMDTLSSGYKKETAETGDELNYMMISFDGASEQSFTFATKLDSTDRINYEYVQYDRFSGKLKRNASILEQIKDKRIMVLNYKQNGSDETAMFQLEGLEAIYNALTEEDE